jgi:ABC-2 type transport system permease protein
MTERAHSVRELWQMTVMVPLRICRHELRVLRTDPQVVGVLMVMPIALTAFLKPTLRYELSATGYPRASGAELAVPGIAIMFGLFGWGFLGLAFFREWMWSTWPRLLASPNAVWQIILGKALAPLLLACVQMTLLFGAGYLLFGLELQKSVADLVAVALCFSICVTFLGMALFTLCRSWEQMNAASNLGAVLLAGLGGALVPLATLPAWIQTIAPVTPTYWAMRGFEAITLPGRSLSDAWLSAVVLLGFAIAGGALAAKRLGTERRL